MQTAYQQGIAQMRSQLDAIDESYETTNGLAICVSAVS